MSTGAVPDSVDDSHTANTAQNLEGSPSLPDVPPPEIVAQVKAVWAKNDQVLLKQICLWSAEVSTLKNAKTNRERKPYLWGLSAVEEPLATKLYSLPNLGIKSRPQENHLRVMLAQAPSMARPAIIGKPEGRAALQYCLWYGPEAEFDRQNGMVAKFTEQSSISAVAAGWKGKKRKSDAMVDPRREDTGHIEQGDSLPDQPLTTLNRQIADTIDDHRKDATDKENKNHNEAGVNNTESNTGLAVSEQRKKARKEPSVGAVPQTPEVPSDDTTMEYTASEARERPAEALDQARPPTPKPAQASPANEQVLDFSIRTANKDDESEIIKDENSSDDELTVFDPKEIEIEFLSSTGQVLETSVVSECNTVEDFFLESVAAGIIQSSDEKCCLGVKIGGVPESEVRLLKRHTAKHLSKLDTKIQELCLAGVTFKVEVKVL